MEMEILELCGDHFTVTRDIFQFAIGEIQHTTSD